MKQLLLITFLVGSVLTGTTFVRAQTIQSAEALNRRVNLILLKKDLFVLADEMARSKATKIDDLLLRIVVFTRATQPDKVRQTLDDLFSAADLLTEEKRGWLAKIVRPLIADDLKARRNYYEHLVKDDALNEINNFLYLWEKSKDTAELEPWLNDRVKKFGGSWFYADLERAVKQGAANSRLDPLAAARQNSDDKNALNFYISAVEYAQRCSLDYLKKPLDHDTSWLAAVYPPTAAVTAFDYGEIFSQINQPLAIEYFKKSLSEAVTAAEIKALEEKYRTPVSYGPQPQTDWEKWLRYRTKEKLAKAYQAIDQAILAQPLIEELVAAKKSDSYNFDDFGLAGAVQSSSGARAVESKIIADEATRSDNAAYWQERVEYYAGRKEFGLVVTAFEEALGKVIKNKMWLIRWFGESDHLVFSKNAAVDAEAKKRLSDILLREFNQVPIDSELAYTIIIAASDENLRLDEFNQAIFVSRRDVFLKCLIKADERKTETSDIIKDVLRDERLTPEQKAFYFAELEKFAAGGSPERYLILHEAYKTIGEYSRLAPLLLTYLAKVKPDAENSASREFATRDLFFAYCQINDWRNAEKLLMQQQKLFVEYLGSCFARLTVAAARADAPNDALRLWRKTINFQGHEIYWLSDVNETSAKPLLREFYLQMKQREPNSVVADEALRVLR